MERLVVVCAWCPPSNQKIDHSSSKVSHGICPQCVEKFFPQIAPSVLKKAA